MSAVPYLARDGSQMVCPAAVEVTAMDSIWGTGGKTTWYVVNQNVTINTRVTVLGDVNLILANGSMPTAAQGIDVTEGNSFTVYAQGGGSPGKLIATGNKLASGIGGGNCGAVTINGGNITAIGGDNACGIGGSLLGNGGTITINGGTVAATGGDMGAGIGIGGTKDGGTANITINCSASRET